MRFVLIPERNEEVIDPLDLGSAQFLERVYEVAHRPSVHIFDYRHSKRDEVHARSLAIYQRSSENWRDGMEEVRLKLRSTGTIIIDANVTGRARRSDSGMMDMFVLAEEEVAAVLDADFRFAGALFSELDKFLRHQRFLYNFAIAGIGYRKLERNPQPRTTFAMGMRSSEEPVTVFEHPRLVDRALLNTPADEVRRSLTMLSRHPEMQ